MKNVVISRLIALGISLGATLGATAAYGADEVLLKQDRPEQYNVVTGDTLWGISERFLEDPWRWKEVWQGNTQIEDPDLIYPGDVIRLIFVDGQPRLTTSRGDNTSVTQNNTANNTESKTTNTGKKVLKTVKLSPKIHSSPVKSAIPAIPLDKINTFLLNNRITDVGSLDSAPHVLAGQEKRVILGAGDTLYSRGSFPNTISSYGIYRKGQSYIDPDTKEVLGVQAIDIGAANIRATEGDVATFTITRSTGEVRVGDRLLPNQERNITASFLPFPPKNDLEGIIFNVERGISQVGLLDIVSVNLGKNQGLEQGNILAIYKRGESLTDRFAQRKTSKTLTLPEERAGLLLVFEVFDKMAMAIVLEADRGISVTDIVRNP